MTDGDRGEGLAVLVTRRVGVADETIIGFDETDVVAGKLVADGLGGGVATDKAREIVGTVPERVLSPPEGMNCSFATGTCESENHANNIRESRAA